MRSASRSVRCSGSIPTVAVTKFDEGIVCSNGPCWSPDGRTFYFADTKTRDIWAYDYDIETGAVSQPAHVLLVSRLRAEGPAGRRDGRCGGLCLERQRL